MPLRALVCAAAGGALLLVGCGGSDYKNDPRPPAPINVTAFVSSKRVSVSPDRFGAGPIVVIVTNQSSTSQEVTFKGAANQDVRQSTLVDPGGTGQLKLDVRAGSYLVGTGDQAIKPATVRVSRERQSAQNQLLQP